MRSFLRNNLINFRGWRTKRKILVIESDDWGSIRMPSKFVYNRLKNSGINVDKSAYCKYDNLESSDDIENIANVLRKTKDINGNSPVITANTVVGNPDFEKIRNDNFRNYYFEPFLETYKRYGSNYNSIQTWNQVINEKLFYPQFHGREHVNVKLWFDLLRKNDPDFILAFNNNMWGLSNDVFPQMKISIQAAFDNTDSEFQIESINSGLELFNQIFGFSSNSFIPNNFIWNMNLNKYLLENGVHYIQGMKFQIGLQNQFGKRKIYRHFTGDTNSLGQIYLVRNCSFEPSVNSDTIEQALNEIRNSFFWKKPAILSIHRLNFMGGIDERNRVNNLNNFDTLLKGILIEWPDVEFLNSDQLGQLISEELKSC
jgi:hypothetical protein